MTCQEAVDAEDVLEYIVPNYLGEDYIKEFFNPDCYMAFDGMQAVIYQQIQQITSENIERYGFSAIPNVYGLMDVEALEESGVLRLRRQPAYDLYGQGILIGFVDTGIDFTHEAFRNADGSTRIAALWDQTIPEGRGPQNLPYGRIFYREEINEALQQEDPMSSVPSRDEIGHGTFLAGVAAGNEERQEDFSGVAPLSELVIVKCKEAKKSYRDYYGIPEDVPAYQENDIMAGISFLLQTAQREQRSVAICIGMGTNMGNHNGDSALPVYMDRYAVAKGVVMVASAGNEGNARHHHHITSNEDTIDIDVESSMKGFMSQLWWRTPGNLTLDIISPSGDAMTGIRAVSGVRQRKTFVPENTTVELYFGISTEQTREQVVVFRFLSPKAGIWKVRVNVTGGSPDYHMWLPISQFLPSDVFFLQPDPDTTVCEPGNGRNLITVSAYDVREGSLYLQASRGFTPLQDVKPEVTAPGVNVTGTYPRGRYGTLSGTSVSASLTTGICALFLQHYSFFGLNGVSAKELLIRGATPRGEPYPNTEWGYGIVDAYRSITGP